MTHHARFQAAMARLPLVAILRGVRPDEVAAIGDALVEAGFALIEVPLNSPDPIESIARLVRQVGDRALVGAGTVLTGDAVAEVAAVGGSLIVSPNCNPEVISVAAKRGMVALPGIMTPTEAFAALGAGASALKLFPADAVGPAMLKALRAVLPASSRVMPVGGITTANMSPWHDAGACGFGLGSSLYRPGMSAQAVHAGAVAFAQAYRALNG
jgi:2-dehydro-3-deoxyphosphogalactonate aldolase